MSKQAPKPMPHFASEAEEAHWWYEQRDRLTAQAEAAATQGTLQLRRLAPSTSQVNSPAKNITLRLPEQDLARAREQAAERGLRYQTYIKLLLHEALEAEEKKIAS